MNKAAILFAIAAVGGATMAAMRLGGRELPPLALALLHGVMAAAGLVTLILAVTGGAIVTGLLKGALVGFVVAALGGAILFLGFHMRKKALPIPLVLIHGSVAVASFVLLLLAMFRV